MTREECEKQIIALARKINNVYREYAPEGKHLVLIIDRDYTGGWNKYFGEDYETPINFSHFEVEGDEE